MTYEIVSRRRDEQHASEFEAFCFAYYSTSHVCGFGVHLSYNMNYDMAQSESEVEENMDSATRIESSVVVNNDVYIERQ